MKGINALMRIRCSGNENLTCCERLTGAGFETCEESRKAVRMLEIMSETGEDDGDWRGG